MANEGYITLSRAILKHWIATDQRWGWWWVMLLFKASWEDTQVEAFGNLITIKRGQMIESCRSLAKTFKSNRRTIERYLQILEKENMIKRELVSDRKLSIITIVNYDKYQMIPNYDEKNVTECTTECTTENEAQTVEIQEIEDSFKIGGAPLNAPLSAPLSAPQLNKINKINKNIKNTTNVVSERASEDGDELKILGIAESIAAEWNESCGELPKIKSLSSRRKLKLGARAKDWGRTEAEALEHARELFSRMARSPFLTGKVTRWKATLDWIIENDTNWRKVEEGNYDDRNSTADDSRGCTPREVRDLIATYQNATGNR